MVDAKHVTQHIDAEGEGSGKEETISQIAFADCILVNKLDLITQEQVKEVAARLSLINAEARVIFCERAQVAIKELMGLQSFDIERATKKLQAKEGADWTSSLTCKPVSSQFPTMRSFGKSSGGHKGISTVSIVLGGQCDLTKLNRWLATLLKERGPDLYRMKGIVAIEGRDEMFIFHGVHMLFTGKEGPKWPGDERESRMVFIGRRLDEESLRRGFQGCVVKEETSLEGVE